MALAEARAPARKSPWLYVFQGATPSCMAVTITNPLEVVKVRLQLQGELVRRGQFKVVYKHLPHGMFVIARQEGLAALQKGLLTAYWYQTFMNGTRLGLYDALIDGAAAYVPNPRESFFVNILCGATAGVVGAAIGSPFYLVKTRLQSAGGAVGEQFVYKGMTDGLRQIIQTSGFRGLWRGADASMLRTGIGSATQLTTYAFSKNLFARSGLVSPDSRMLIEMGGAMISGAVVAVVMNPFDVISTRLYNQNPGAPLYSGPLNCLLRILKTEGPLGFFKGVGTHFLRIGPHTFLTFLFWENIKRYMNKA